MILPRVLVLGAATLAGALGSPHHTVATATNGRYRVVVTAVRTSAGAAPTARVVVTTYARRATWSQTSTQAMRGTFFWKTLTGPHAVCQLRIAPTPTPTATIQLLVTPATGCGPVTLIRLPKA